MAFVQRRIWRLFSLADDGMRFPEKPGADPGEAEGPAFPDPERRRGRRREDRGRVPDADAEYPPDRFGPWVHDDDLAAVIVRDPGGRSGLRGLPAVHPAADPDEQPEGAGSFFRSQRGDPGNPVRLFPDQNFSAGAVFPEKD